VPPCAASFDADGREISARLWIPKWRRVKTELGSRRNLEQPAGL